MQAFMFIFITFILVFIVAYRHNKGTNVYKYVVTQVGMLYDKYAPYSFKSVRTKAKELGQEYTTRQYTIQVAIFAGGSFVLSYLYFYNLIISFVYMILSVLAIPYLSYLRCKRIYSEFIFEQIQVYTTNTIMEFATTQSFVKALEGVYSSGVLEDPVKRDVKAMIDLAYENGTIEQSLTYMNDRYNFFVVRNMHQLFLQITNEGSKDSTKALENMSLDIDMLVENVYRDRIERSQFHKKFVQFGVLLYLMVMLVQFLLGVDSYVKLLDNLLVLVLLHVIILVNTYFLISGEKYYNEDVGAE